MYYYSLQIKMGLKKKLVGVGPTIQAVVAYQSRFCNVNASLNSVARVLERTVPTERPPLVGEVNANFCG
jgi:hypothetical protein